nr:hypothetical protein [uncultured Dethiosulfovibrio sp.]
MDGETFTVESVIWDDDVAKVAVLGVPDRPGIAAHLFKALGDAMVPVEMVIQSVMRGDVNDIAFLIRTEKLDSAIEVCRRMPDEIGAQGVTFDTEVSRIALYGQGFSSRPGLPSDVFSLLAEGGINLEMIVATPESICCVVCKSSAAEALSILRDRFIGGLSS